MAANWFNSGGEEQVVGKIFFFSSSPPRRLEDLKRARLLRWCSRNIIIRGEPKRVSASLSMMVGALALGAIPSRRPTATKPPLVSTMTTDAELHLHHICSVFPPHQNYSEPGWTDSGQSSTANKGHLEFDLVILPSTFRTTKPSERPCPPSAHPLLSFCHYHH